MACEGDFHDKESEKVLMAADQAAPVFDIEMGLSTSVRALVPYRRIHTSGGKDIGC